jgi:hypothetical protein
MHNAQWWMRRWRDVLNAQLRDGGLTMRSIIFASTAGMMALCFLACGGGGKKPEPTPAPIIATSLTYADPPASGYRLVRGAASSGGLLVLELRGPAGIMGRGATFSVEADAAKAEFVKVSTADAEMAHQGDVFQLGGSPQLFKAILDGNALRVSLAQKGKGNPQSLDGVLARVALQLKTGAAQGAITLRVVDAKILPAADSPQEGISIACGTLAAQ